MWDVWLDLEEELQERSRFSPMTELLKSPEASKLLAPVPQLAVPQNANSPNYYQLELDKIKAEQVLVGPVDVQTVDAIMESPRLGHREVTRGTILAAREPDLNVNYNFLVSFRGWEKTHP
jgi:hypothetical protein